MRDAPFIATRHALAAPFWNLGADSFCRWGISACPHDLRLDVFALAKARANPRTTADGMEPGLDTNASHRVPQLRPSPTLPRRRGPDRSQYRRRRNRALTNRRRRFRGRTINTRSCSRASPWRSVQGLGMLLLEHASMIQQRALLFRLGHGLTPCARRRCSAIRFLDQTCLRTANHWVSRARVRPAPSARRSGHTLSSTLSHRRV